MHIFFSIHMQLMERWKVQKQQFWSDFLPLRLKSFHRLESIHKIKIYLNKLKNQLYIKMNWKVANKFLFSTQNLFADDKKQKHGPFHSFGNNSDKI